MPSISREEFISLYDTYAPKIYRFLLAKVSSVETAQDLTSETFLKAWDYAQKGENAAISQPAAFLFRIARNLTIDYYRMKSSQKEILFGDDTMKDLGQIEDAKSDTGQKTIDNWDASDIKDKLAKMSQKFPDYADVLVLYYVEDVPIAGIAKIMDKSEGTVRVLIHRALKELRSRI